MRQQTKIRVPVAPPRNIMAIALADPRYAPKVIKNKKAYDRKRVERFSD